MSTHYPKPEEPKKVKKEKKKEVKPKAVEVKPSRGRAGHIGVLSLQ